MCSAWRMCIYMRRQHPIYKYGTHDGDSRARGLAVSAGRPAVDRQTDRQTANEASRPPGSQPAAAQQQQQQQQPGVGQSGPVQSSPGPGPAACGVSCYTRYSVQLYIDIHMYIAAVVSQGPPARSLACLLACLLEFGLAPGATSGTWCQVLLPIVRGLRSVCVRYVHVHYVRSTVLYSVLGTVCNVSVPPPHGVSAEQRSREKEQDRGKIGRDREKKGRDKEKKEERGPHRTTRARRLCGLSCLCLRRGFSLASRSRSQAQEKHMLYGVPMRTTAPTAARQIGRAAAAASKSTGSPLFAAGLQTAAGPVQTLRFPLPGRPLLTEQPAGHWYCGTVQHSTAQQQVHTYITLLPSSLLLRTYDMGRELLLLLLLANGSPRPAAMLHRTPSCPRSRETGLCPLCFHPLIHARYYIAALPFPRIFPPPPPQTLLLALLTRSQSPAAAADLSPLMRPPVMHTLAAPAKCEYSL